MNSSTRPNDMHTQIKSKYSPLPEKPNGFKALSIIIITTLGYAFLGIPIINELGDIKGFIHFIAFFSVASYVWATGSNYFTAKDNHQNEVAKRKATADKYQRMQTWYDGDRHTHKTGGGYKMFGDSNSKYPIDWKERREYAQTRDGNCALCNGTRSLFGEYKLRNEVHHIIPISKGGTHEVDNLVALCSICHDDQHEHLLQRRITMYKNSPKRHSKNYPKWQWVDNAEKRLRSLQNHRAISGLTTLHKYNG